MELRELRTLAAQMGATLRSESNGRTYAVAVEAPAGFVWRSDDLHELVESTFEGDKAWRAAARKDLAERMRMGLEKCSDPACEWCE